jgi:hypothetical protein
MTRIVKQKLYTPTLRVKYIGLAAPYHFNEKDLRGSYSIALVGTPAEIDEFREQMDQVHEELVSAMVAQEGKKLKRNDPFSPIVPEEDKEGNETGNFLIKLKHAAKGISSKTGKEWAITPKVFDAKGTPIAEEIIPKIGWGSTVKCSFDARAYLGQAGKVGVVYDLRATQLLVPQWYEGEQTNDFEGSREEGFTVASEGADF